MNRFGTARAPRITSADVAFIMSLSPAAWFRYGQGITSAVNAVSQWNDQSGNGRNLKQGTGAAQPTLQADGPILFNGTSQFLKCDAFTLNQPETVYCLARPESWVGLNALYDGNVSDTMHVIQQTTTPNIDMYAGALIAAQIPFTLSQYAVISAVFNSASSSLRKNSATAVTGNAGAAAGGGFCLCRHGSTADRFGNFTIKEVIVFAAAHDTATQNTVINYLSRVGGL